MSYRELGSLHLTQLTRISELDKNDEKVEKKYIDNESDDLGPINVMATNVFCNPKRRKSYLTQDFRGELVSWFCILKLVVFFSLNDPNLSFQPPYDDHSFQI